MLFLCYTSAVGFGSVIIIIIMTLPPEMSRMDAFCDFDIFAESVTNIDISLKLCIHDQNRSTDIETFDILKSITAKSIFLKISTNKLVIL